MTVDIPRVAGRHQSRCSAGAVLTTPAPLASHGPFRTSCLNSKRYEKDR